MTLQGERNIINALTNSEVSLTEDKSRQIEYRRAMNLFIQICRRHRTEAENRIRSLPIHGSQHRVLMTLSHSKPNISQKELAKELNISTAAAAVTLKKLEKEGYISRSVSKADNRFNEIVITDSGRHILEESIEIFDALDSKAFCGFTAEELKILNSLLEKIKGNFDSVQGHFFEGDDR